MSCVCGNAHVDTGTPGSQKRIWIPGAGVTGKGSGKQTWVLWRSSRCSLPSAHLTTFERHLIPSFLLPFPAPNHCVAMRVTRQNVGKFSFFILL